MFQTIWRRDLISASPRGRSPLLTVVLDDASEGMFDGPVGVHVGRRRDHPPLLGFVLTFGSGIIEPKRQDGHRAAAILGAVAGAMGFGLVSACSRVLRRSGEPRHPASTTIVGQIGRVSVRDPGRRYGSVFISYAGSSHNLTATSDVDVAPGSSVRVTGIAGSNVVVEPVARVAS